MPSIADLGFGELHGYAIEDLRLCEATLALLFRDIEFPMQMAADVG